MTNNNIETQATSTTCPTPDKTTAEETSEEEIMDVDPSNEVDHDHPNHHELQDSLVDHDLTHPHHMKGATAVGIEEHFSIQCPYKTNEEKELKLFYMYRVYIGRLSREEENKLRKQYDLENLSENR